MLYFLTSMNPFFYGGIIALMMAFDLIRICFILFERGYNAMQNKSITGACFLAPKENTTGKVYLILEKPSAGKQNETDQSPCRSF